MTQESTLILQDLTISENVALGPADGPMVDDLAAALVIIPELLITTLDIRCTAEMNLATGLVTAADPEVATGPIEISIDVGNAGAAERAG